jgi:hypothetical protein
MSHIDFEINRLSLKIKTELTDDTREILAEIITNLRGSLYDAIENDTCLYTFEGRKTINVKCSQITSSSGRENIKRLIYRLFIGVPKQHRRLPVCNRGEKSHDCVQPFHIHESKTIHRRRKLSVNDVLMIYDSYNNQTLPSSYVQEDMNISKETYYDITHGRSWRNYTTNINPNVARSAVCQPNERLLASKRQKSKHQNLKYKHMKFVLKNNTIGRMLSRKAPESDYDIISRLVERCNHIENEDECFFYFGTENSIGGEMNLREKNIFEMEELRRQIIRKFWYRGKTVPIRKVIYKWWIGHHGTLDSINSEWNNLKRNGCDRQMSASKSLHCINPKHLFE